MRTKHTKKHQSNAGGRAAHHARALPGTPGAVLLLLLLVALCCWLLPGCAIHHSNSHTGLDDIWGFGCVRYSTNAVGAHFQTVAAETAVPGLSVGFGLDHLGVSLGYWESQRLAVEPLTMSSNRVQRTFAIPLWKSGSGRVWAFGWQRLSTPPASRHRQAFVTARAIAGLSAHLGGGDSSLHAGAHAVKTTFIQSADTYLTFGDTNARWPYFDVMTMMIGAPDLRLQLQPDSPPW